MRRPAKSMLVEFFSVKEDGNKDLIIGLDLLQAPAVGEVVHFAKVEKFKGNFIVTNVRWFCGVSDGDGRTSDPTRPDGTAFQTAVVDVKPA